VFAPQGLLHYFENSSDGGPPVVRNVFTSSATGREDGIGMVLSLSSRPGFVLGLVFGAEPGVFDRIPRRLGCVTTAKRSSAGSGEEHSSRRMTAEASVRRFAHFETHRACPEPPLGPSSPPPGAGGLFLS
jgi:hypothetical protein